MPDRLFSEQKLADLYDLFNPWMKAPDDAFYLDRVLSASSVLDVGTGTGMLLDKAREAGHTGRLVGLDPADAMLNVAQRKRSNVEWIPGDLSTVSFDQEFQLVVMTAHVFQIFLEDDDVRETLAAVRQALTSDGQFIFETRNPGAKAWETWVPENAAEVTDEHGNVVRMAHQYDPLIVSDTVSFDTTITSSGFEGVELSRSTLRFMDAETLNSFLNDAGLTIESQYGYWDGSPVQEDSSEIITITRRR